MKRIIILLLLIMPLSACEKIKDTILNKLEAQIPESSTAQNEKAKQLYHAVIQRDMGNIYTLVGPNIRVELDQKPDVLKAVFEILPNYEAENPSIVMTTKAIELPLGKVTKIGYKYDYPNQPILFSVVYKGHEGGDEIVGFWVQPL